MSKFNRVTLNRIRNEVKANQSEYISIGMSACGLAAGAQAVYDVFYEQIKSRKSGIRLIKCGCSGLCYAEPLVEVRKNGLPTVTYGKVTPDMAMRIMDQHIQNSMLIDDSIVKIRENTG
ncbi:MAG TPA: (2Fe-2S) ferredoxin domain-containing protein [Dehalococcoidales bacterium]|nr:(2Fe-2S) ferredoxin domain-containing protein [Dehalococcoidales bacterium]